MIMWGIAFHQLYGSMLMHHQPLKNEIKACGLALFESGGKQPLKRNKIRSNKDRHLIICQPNDSPRLLTLIGTVSIRLIGSAPLRAAPARIWHYLIPSCKYIETLMTHIHSCMKQTHKADGDTRMLVFSPAYPWHECNSNNWDFLFGEKRKSGSDSLQNKVMFLH